MRIAIVGTGAIGSVFAFRLARAGHAVTVVARGARLAELRRDQAIVAATGERVAVQVQATLDAATPWDLVLVTVLAPQVDAVLPALQASAARTVMFMFNTFEPLDRLRDAVGAARFAFGFPAIVASLVEGRLAHRVFPGTTVTDAAWAAVFSDAGIRTVVHGDMQSWLRTHAALIVPLAALGVVAHTRGAGATTREARAAAHAMAAGFAAVRTLGNAITPGAMVAISRLPSPVVAALLWALSRTKTLRDLGKQGAGEARALIDAMSAAAPDHAAALRAIRP